MKDQASKPIKLRNFTNNAEVFDTLHNRNPTDGECTREVCGGSLVYNRKAIDCVRPKEEVVRLAKEFIDEYYESNKRFDSDQHQARWLEIREQIDRTGVYELTQTELVYGCKLAWRNAVRCIGRIQWSKLQVFDGRHVTSASGMFEAICNHIKYATNKGNIRSAITVFPPRIEGKPDFKVWNAQLISYAGYKNPDGSITGDPANIEFTEICQRLGWKSRRTRWDVLPVVVSANGHDPEFFELDPSLVLEVEFTHPEYDWFRDLGLKWYALPAVSSMLLDCGGLLFPATPFNGWYMSTEIGSRDLGDVQRYNMLEVVANKMNVDTRNPITLWKDKAMVALNEAVLYSFQLSNTTIVDHHTASESFMKHYENEQRLRGGCPADWVWITPPMSGSACPVFHQEMSVYYLSPSFEYQSPAWKTHVWKKRDRDGVTRSSLKKNKRKFRFKEIARAVKFTSKLFGKALSKRIKATILYATETGKSESYAKRLADIFGHTFNAQVCCMDDYDIIDIEHEALVLVVTSTFGNGDPPENGEKFSKSLYSMKCSGSAITEDTTKNSSSSFKFNYSTRKSMNRSMSFKRMNSQSEVCSPLTPPSSTTTPQGSAHKRLAPPDDNMGPLSNVRYAVFALGSSAYPNFCAYGMYVDTLMGDLGGERLMGVCCGDELDGQEQTFNQWAKEVFLVGCEAFCLDDDSAIRDATAALKADVSHKSLDVKLTSVAKGVSPEEGLHKAHQKNVLTVPVINSLNLHGEKANIPPSDSRWTQQIVLDISKTKIKYSPGDHLAIYPVNKSDLVSAIISRIKNLGNAFEPVSLMNLKEMTTSNGIERTWIEHDRLPQTDVNDMLTRYLDITTPPSPNFLRMLSAHAKNNTEKEKLDMLANDAHEYEEWKHRRYPHLLEVMKEFPSVEIDAPTLLSQLPVLIPRFYSISSSPDAHPGQLHLTVAVVIYRTENGKGPIHYGVCSNFLRALQKGDSVQCSVRRASSFHLPEDHSRPIIMVGPGTGVAPFRGFWFQRLHDMNRSYGPFGDMVLFFGCRTKTLDLYASEKEKMVQEGVLSKSHLALSREPHVQKTYVQDLLVEEGKSIVNYLVDRQGHFYVCGDCTMAENVLQRLRNIFLQHTKWNEQEVENFMITMRDENRYHEDIFGITLRTEEIHRQTRESARSKLPLSRSLSSAMSE